MRRATSSGWMSAFEKTMQNSSQDHASPRRLEVRYFDGRSSRPHLVEAWWEGPHLHLAGPQLRVTLDGDRIQWPERTRHGPRLALLPGGGSLQSIDAAAWDGWMLACGLNDSWVVRGQQSWRGVLATLAVLLVLGAAVYAWGLPWLARGITAAVPDAWEQQVGEVAMSQLERVIAPSQLDAADQQSVEQAWERVRTAHAAAEVSRGRSVRPTRLLMRSSRIGPNALALPGGTLVLTDDLVRLVQNDTEVLAGVLAHELGHVQHRHGMRMLVQVGVLGAVSSVVWGDYSGILATVPVWLGQAHYSREAERESDAYSVAVLRDAGISPGVMVTLFDRLELFRRCGREVLQAPGAGLSTPCGSQAPDKDPSEGPWGLGFASHPADAERKAFFRSAANGAGVEAHQR